MAADFSRHAATRCNNIFSSVRKLFLWSAILYRFLCLSATVTKWVMLSQTLLQDNRVYASMSGVLNTDSKNRYVSKTYIEISQHLQHLINAITTPWIHHPIPWIHHLSLDPSYTPWIHTQPLPCEQTNACENITIPILRTRSVKVKLLILRYQEQVLARPVGLMRQFQNGTISSPSEGGRKPQGENHQALAVKGERHPTCGLDSESNPGRSVRGERVTMAPPSLFGNKVIK